MPAVGKKSVRMRRFPRAAAALADRTRPLPIGRGSSFPPSLLPTVIKAYWRSSRSGVLPDGYDASSIAAQAFLQFFLHSETRHSRDPSLISWTLRRYVLRPAASLKR